MDWPVIPLGEPILQSLLRGDCSHQAHGFGLLSAAHILDISKLALPLHTVDPLAKSLASYVIRAYLGDDEGVAILAGIKVASMCCRSSLRTTRMGENECIIQNSNAFTIAIFSSRESGS